MDSINGTVTITNTTNKPMEITEILPPNDKVDAKMTVVEQNKKFTLDIVVLPPFRDGHVRENITLKTGVGKKA